MPTGVYKHQLNQLFQKGHSVSEEIKNKMSQLLKGKHISPNTEFKNGQSSWNKGFSTSEETKRKISKANSGKEHPNWQGGITSLIRGIRNSYKYRQWRDDVYTRDNFICQECGDNRGHNLNTHHIISTTEILQFYEITTIKESLECERLWNINNGITLCIKCHRLAHKRKEMVINAISTK